MCYRYTSENIVREHCRGVWEGLWMVFERSLQCIVALWQTNAAQDTTLFGLTGRFCGIAQPLLIHGTVAVSLCLPWRWLICLRHGGEVNSPWKEKKNARFESTLIIHLCCVSVWCNKSISIILHTDCNFFFFVYCVYVGGFLRRFIAINVCAGLIVAA